MCQRSLTQDEYKQAPRCTHAARRQEQGACQSARTTDCGNFPRKANTSLPHAIAICTERCSPLREPQKMATTPNAPIRHHRFLSRTPATCAAILRCAKADIVGRREFFWEDLDPDVESMRPNSGRGLAQYYSTDYVPLEIHVPQDFDDP